MPKSHKLVYAIYVLVWIIMAINPKFPQDWLLENVLVFLVFPFIVWMDKFFLLSFGWIKNITIAF
jgi:putative membrane protein